MADVRVIANVGIFKGLNGSGVIYVGKTTGGSFFALLKSLEGALEKWRYYRKARIETGMSSGEIQMATDFNMTLLTDVEAPDFAPDGGDFPEVVTVTNGDDLVRLYNLNAPYSLKGEGVTAAEIESLKVSSTSGAKVVKSQVTNADGTITITYTDGTTETKAAGSVTQAGALGGIIPTDFSLAFSNPLKFIQDNPVFLLLVIGVIYFIRRKKKKPLWIF